MKNIKNKLSVFAGQKGQLVLAILTITLFVFNATIGIGR